LTGYTRVSFESLDQSPLGIPVPNLKKNPFWRLREYQYYRIRPRILIEALIDDGDPMGPLDYRFWCFDGTPRLVHVDDRQHTINPFYDTNWRKVGLSYRSHFREREIPPPPQLAEMISVASKLSHGIDFIRVDLYNAEGRVFFGELTLTPVGGKVQFAPIEWNARLGAYWIFNEALHAS